MRAECGFIPYSQAISERDGLMNDELTSAYLYITYYHYHTRLDTSFSFFLVETVTELRRFTTAHIPHPFF